MSPNSLISLSLLALCMILSQPLITHAILEKFSVHIINGFKNDTLEAHCKSKQDDLGVRHIRVKDEFAWRFRVNFWGSTLYWCHLWWAGGQRSFEVFAADDGSFIEKDCGKTNCLWMFKEDGIYLYNYQHSEYRFQFKWEPWKKFEGK